MSDQMADQTNQPLARELGDLRRWVVFPSSPDLAAAVSVRLRHERRPRFSLLQGGRRSALAAAAVILLAIIAATALSGTVRDAVADALGIPGIRIEFDDDSPTVTPSTTLPDLGLGENVSLTTAKANVGFDVLAPAIDVFGLPDSTYLRQLPDGTELVSFVYLPDDRFPETAETGLGLLLMEFEADVGVEYMIKSIGRYGDLRNVLVNGSSGFWVEGTSRLTITGACCDTRLTGNILLWQRNGVTYRMESAMSMTEAIEVAKGISGVPASLLTPTAEP